MKKEYDSDRDSIMESLRNFVSKHNVLDYMIEFNKNDNPMLHKIVITEDETKTSKYGSEKLCQFGISCDEEHCSTKYIVDEYDFCGDDEYCSNCVKKNDNDNYDIEDEFIRDNYSVIRKDIDKIITIKNALDSSGCKYEMIFGNDDKIIIKYL